MTKKALQRLKLGDMVELRSSKGYFYAQFINEHDRPPHYGAVVRMLPGISRQPRDIAELAAVEDALWCCFWPVKWAVKAGEARLVGHAPVPKQWRKMPIFKAGTHNLFTGKCEHWQLWTGKTHKGTPVRKLSAEQRKYPILQILCTDDLRARVENGWLPEDNCHDSPRPSSAMLPRSRLSVPPKKTSAGKLSLIDNDAASDFLADVANDGLPKVRHALAYMKRAAGKASLERDDANIILAIAAICMAKRGSAPRDADKLAIFEGAIAKCRGDISGKTLMEVTRLLEQIIKDSELRDLMQEAGTLKPWTSRVRQWLRRLKGMRNSK